MMRLLGGLALGGVLALTACTPTTTTSPSPSTAATTAPIPTASASATSATASIPETMTVTVYFSNSVLDPGASDCAQVYAVHRTVPASSDVLTVTLKELVAGPTHRGGEGLRFVVLPGDRPGAGPRQGHGEHQLREPHRCPDGHP